MLDTQVFVSSLVQKVSFFAGVPDSLLKDLNACLIQTLPAGNFTTAVDEGSAVALCAGYTLATGKPGAVYMQNSGLGNSINPLLSLSDELVYGIPVLLIVGWRGEPDKKDEPQHKKQGLVTLPLLETCGIPYRILSADESQAQEDLNWAMAEMEKSSAPVALVVQKGTFSPFAYPAIACESMLSREETIGCILRGLDVNCRIVSTTGMISRELYELREKCGHGHQDDFLTVGSMGYASQIALGLALQKPEHKIVCLDGDGALLMHMGALAAIGNAAPQNYLHILLDNGVHDSVGGQPTIMGGVCVENLAKSCGYKAVLSASGLEELRETVKRAVEEKGPVLMHVKVAPGSRKDLGRPKETPRENKAVFMRHL